MSRSRTTARRLLALGVAVALSGVLAACAAEADKPATNPSSAIAQGPWSFTDDRGKRIDLPKRPERIVAQSHPAAALFDLGIKPVGVFGPQRTADGKPSPQIGNLDLTGVESVGTAFGEFQLEKLIALKPDLIVTIAYGPMVWYIPEDVIAKVEKVAPIAVIQMASVSVPDAVKRFSDLSAALGADPNSPAIQQSKNQFDTASAALKTAVAAKPGLTVAVVSGTRENLFVADPAFHGDIKYLQQLGVKFVAPAKPEAGFESLSWEEAGRYPADLVLEDARPEGGLDHAQMAAYPAWQGSPAVKANQVIDWQTETPFTYQRFTKVITGLSAAITKADATVVP